jgi:hypothetical protein
MNVSQTNTLINAIVDHGGICPAKIKAAGTWTEWSELPSKIRARIFRHASSNGPDEISDMVKCFGIESEADLLSWLKDPVKARLTETEARDYDLLVAELRQTKAELEQLQNSRPYRIEFVQRGRNFIPVRVPVTDVPF